jgi:hypothetical protein
MLVYCHHYSSYILYIALASKYSNISICCIDPIKITARAIVGSFFFVSNTLADVLITITSGILMIVYGIAFVFKTAATGVISIF